MFVDKGGKLVPVWDGKGDYAGARGRGYLWVGNSSVGFDWFCESDANWNNGPSEKPFRVIRDGKTTHMRFLIVTKPATVREPLEYTFGFQATPVKPFSKAYRAFRLGSDRMLPGQNARIIGYDSTFEYVTWLIPQDPPISANLSLASVLKETKERGIGCLAYTSGISTADNNPVWDFFGEVWKNPYGPISGGYHTRRDGKVYSLAPVSPRDWSPFLAWMADRLLADPANKNISGIYIDNTSPYPTKNRFNGTGYEKDAFGKSGFTYPILGLRDIFIRLLRTIRRHRGTEGVFMAHAHNAMILPIHGLADYFFPGEQYGYLIPGKPYFYMEDVPLDVYRVEMNAAPYGLPQVLCTVLSHMFPIVEKKDYYKWAPHPSPLLASLMKKHRLYRTELISEPSESLIAMMLLHDLPFNIHAMYPDAVKKVFDLQDRLSLSDAEFLPYWKENGVHCIETKAKASVYGHARSLAVVLVNFTPKDRDVTIEIRPAFFGWKDMSPVARDERRGEDLALENNRVRMRVKQRNYTIISLSAAN